MKSRITIELDFDTGNPYIRVINNDKSDDVRDKLITFFRQRLGYTSSWARVQFRGDFKEDEIMFEIHPIKPEELRVEGETMLFHSKSNGDFLQKPSLSH